MLYDVLYRKLQVFVLFSPKVKMFVIFSSYVEKSSIEHQVKVECYYAMP